MKENKGITLLALMVSIIIIIIILGIAVNSGNNTLKKSKMGNMISAMELIKVRAEDYYEEISFEEGNKDFETYLMMMKNEKFIKKDAELEKIVLDKTFIENNYFIKWDTIKLKEQGIDSTIIDTEEDFFIIAYNYDNREVQNVYYSRGFKLDDENIIYSLTQLKENLGK